jgi:hypothetical protein
VRFAGGMVVQHVCRFYPNLPGGDRAIPLAGKRFSG